MPYAKIHIENLGPIRSGTFELRPLTLFIGPNNSGKTYAATAAYALVNALAFDRRHRKHRLDDFLFGDAPDRSRLMHDSRNGFRITTELENQVHSRLEVIRDRALERLTASISDAFTTDNVASLAPAANVAAPLQLSLLKSSGDKSAIGVRSNGIIGSPYDSLELRHLSQLGIDDADEAHAGPLHDGFPDDEIAKELWGDLLDDLGLPVGEALYLPAARLGIIQGWTVLAASAISSLRQRASRLRDELPPIGGVYADYLSSLVSLGGVTRRRPDFPRHFVSAAKLLETDIIKGRIVIESTALGVIRIVYRTDSFDLPLVQASSTVADMAPLAIAMKEQLSQGDLLIIDEPEAHLHPENERLAAMVLARLAKADVRVLIPTHSSTLLHQVSNIVRAGRLDEKERDRLGYTEDDRLDPEQVAVYRFRPTDDGTVIDEVPYDSDFGFSEEEFYEVAEDISRESYQIDNRLPALTT